MKRNSIFYSMAVCFLLLITGSKAHSQQMPFLQGYKDNPFLYNPAAAGSLENMRAYAGFRKEYDKMPFSPTSYIAALDGRIYQTNHGFGGIIQMDKTHLLSNIKGSLAYSYKLDFDTARQHRLTLGVGLSIVRQQFDFSNAISYTPGDLGLLPQNNTNAVFDASFGFVYQYKQFHANMAALQLFNSKVYFRDEIQSDNNIYYSLNRHFVGSLSYDFYAGNKKEHTLTPLYNFMLTKGGLFFNDFGVKYNYNNFLNLGTGARFSFDGDSPKFIWTHAGVVIHDCVSVGYYFQTNVSGSCDGTKPHCNNGGCLLFNLQHDEKYHTSNCGIDLTLLAPEKYSVYTCSASSGSEGYQLHYNFKYTFPQLDAPNATQGAIRYCANKSITLTTNIPLVTNKTGVRYIWKYSYDAISYNAIDTTVDSFITFNPWQVFSMLDTARYITSIKFKVEGLNDDGHSGESSMSQYEFAPKAPVAQFVAGHPSCQNNYNTGVIEINNIVGVADNFRYILRSGFFDTTGCDPNNLSSCATALSGSFSGFNFDVLSVPFGQYTLVLANPGGAPGALPNTDYGACYSWYNVNIDSIPLITQIIDSFRNLSCYQSNDGAIYMRCKKTQAPFTFDISPQAGALIQNDTFAAFTNLPAGTYYVRSKDFCDYFTSKDTVVITQPAQILTNVSINNQANCFSPYNGAVSITASNASSFSYRIAADGIAKDSLLNTTDTIWNLTGLAPATYTYSVQDASRPDCPLTYGTFDITPPVVLSGQATAAAVTCNGLSNGAITTVAAGGQQGNYIFLLHQNGTVTATNNTGQFNGLLAGSYAITIKNNNAICYDSIVIDNVNVQEPLPLGVSMQTQNVSCTGSNNGSITATVTGGTAPYTYQWQFLAGSTWTNYTINGQGTGNAISGLFPTSYRVIITDAQSCVFTSAPENVIEPNSLTVDSVTKQDVVCFSSVGSLHVYAQGGTIPYQYRVSADNGITFTPYNNDDPLYAGTYLIEISDAGGCVQTYPQAFTITQPANPLDVQVNMPFYNGYQIACNGGNVSGSFAATGGNGNGFSGYSFNLNNTIYSPDTVFTGLPAGSYNIKVKDGRGCIVNKDFNVLQPNVLDIIETMNHGTLCANVPSGATAVMGQGGASPYTYAIGSGLYNTMDTFHALYPGSYLLKVRDANGCVDSLSVAILSQYTDINLQQYITNVSCYGLSDGAFNINAQGGAGSYNYHWLKGNFSTNATTGQGLAADSFVVKITDQAGCTDTFDVIVHQPDTALYQSLFVQAICPGSGGGKVIALAKGGTPPYRYALNNGTFISDSTFPNLQEGNYSLMVKDANGCTADASFQIAPLAQPNVRFLITTKEYVNDTLVLVNVSVPETDSVQWIFPAQTTVYNVDRDTAWIRYNDTGSYEVIMRAFYQNCTFDINKNIKVTPKNDTLTNPNSNNEILNFTASPNPTSGQIHVVVNLNQETRYLQLQLTDALGQVLWQTTQNDIRNYETDINALQGNASGTYFLLAITENEYKKITVVKQ